MQPFLNVLRECLMWLPRKSALEALKYILSLLAFPGPDSLLVSIASKSCLPGHDAHAPVCLKTAIFDASETAILLGTEEKQGLWSYQGPVVFLKEFGSYLFHEVPSEDPSFQFNLKISSP